jgi:hypothetical protein
MSNFVEKLRLAEKAAEDIYFAKVIFLLMQVHKVINTSYKRTAKYRCSIQG